MEEMEKMENMKEVHDFSQRILMRNTEFDEDEMGDELNRISGTKNQCKDDDVDDEDEFYPDEEVWSVD